MKSSIFLSFILTSILILAGCATVYNPVTGQPEMIFIDTPSEVAMGRNIVREVEYKYPVYKDETLTAYVENIGQRVARVSDRLDLPYHFKIVNDQNFNAFTIPGGYVYVNKGLLEQIKSDDQLAAVLAHEIGHIAARHAAKQIQAQLGYSIIMDIALGASGSQDLAQTLNVTFNLISSGYSREDELQADKLSVRYLNKTGFNPNAALEVLAIIKELEKSNPASMLVFIRSHPPAERRISVVKEELAKLANN